MLAARGLAPLAQADVRPMIGDGTKKLVERALGARGVPYDDATERAMVADYTDQSQSKAGLIPASTRPWQSFRKRAGNSPSAPTNRPQPRKPCSAHSISRIGSRRSVAAIPSPCASPTRDISPARSKPPAARHAQPHGRRSRKRYQRRQGARPADDLRVWGYGKKEMADGASAVAERFAALATLGPKLLS